jgi:hypothetical protein
MRRSFSTISRRISSRFAVRSFVKKWKPVSRAPGCAMLYDGNTAGLPAVVAQSIQEQLP